MYLKFDLCGNMFGSEPFESFLDLSERICLPELEVKKIHQFDFLKSHEQSYDSLVSLFSRFPS